MKSISQYIAQRLSELEIKVTFGTPGNYNYEQIQAIQNYRGLSFCSSNSATEAVIAAAGYAKTTRLPGFVLISHGSNITNSLSGVLNAKFEKVPLIIVDSIPPYKRNNYNEKKTSRTTYQIFEGVTVECVRVPYSNHATDVIDQAFTKCWAYRKPVYLEIPEDVFSFKVEEPKKRISKENFVSDKNELENSVKEIMKMFSNSKSPLLVFGEEVIRESQEKLLEKFLIKSKLHYMVTLSGKSVVSEKLGKFGGVFMGRSSNKSTYDLFKDADYVLFLGVGIVENSAMSIYLDDFPQKNYITAYDGFVKNDSFTFGPVVIKDLLEGMNNAINYSFPINKSFKYDDYFQNYDTSKAGFTHDGIVKKIIQSGILKGKTILGDNSISLFTVGNIPVEEENLFFSENIWHTKGYPLYSSIGTYKGTSKRPVVFVSDGGLQNAFYSITTHVREKTKAVIFVFNNGINALTQWHQNPKAFKQSGKIDEFNILPRINWKVCGESIGAKVFNVQSYDELSETLEKVENLNDVGLILLKIPQKNIPENSLWKVEKSSE